MPGAVPTITREAVKDPMRMQTRSKAPATYTPIPSRAQQKIVTRQAINVLTMMEKVSVDNIFVPRNLEQSHQAAPGPVNLKHYMNPAIHPVTGETFTSYKKAMKDPAIAEVWMTAFGKDFGGLAQGDNKTNTKGTNAMFVMTHARMPACGNPHTALLISMCTMPFFACCNRLYCSTIHGGNRARGIFMYS